MPMSGYEGPWWLCSYGWASWQRHELCCPLSGGHGMNPSLVEHGVCSTSVMSCTWTKNTKEAPSLLTFVIICHIMCCKHIITILRHTKTLESSPYRDLSLSPTCCWYIHVTPISRYKKSFGCPFLAGTFLWLACMVMSLLKEICYCKTPLWIKNLEIPLACMRIDLPWLVTCCKQIIIPISGPKISRNPPHSLLICDCKYLYICCTGTSYCLAHHQGNLESGHEVCVLYWHLVSVRTLVSCMAILFF